VTISVLSVAYPLARVGPDAVGGAEQVLARLDAALVARGHRSLVLACEGSRVSGTLVPISWPASAFDETIVARTHEEQRNAIERLRLETDIDLVHMHGVYFFRALPEAGIPVLATVHLPPAWYPAEVFAPTRPSTYLSCVSQSQLRACPDRRAIVATIVNGVDVEAAAPHARRNFCLAMGRICEEKAFHLAIDAARFAETPLLIAGQVYPFPAHQEYFERAIAPRLGAAVRFIGPIGPTRKRRLLSAARCLLVPSLVEETSSLVAMEALACGTPVIAFRTGALPEIVEHGRTGFVVDTLREMGEAIRKIDAIDHNACRNAARERFAASRMVDEYIAVYERLIAQSRRA